MSMPVNQQIDSVCVNADDVLMQNCEKYIKYETFNVNISHSEFSQMVVNYMHDPSLYYSLLSINLEKFTKYTEFTNNFDRELYLYYNDCIIYKIQPHTTLKTELFIGYNDMMSIKIPIYIKKIKKCDAFKNLTLYLREYILHRYNSVKQSINDWNDMRFEFMLNHRVSKETSNEIKSANVNSDNKYNIDNYNTLCDGKFCGEKVLASNKNIPHFVKFDETCVINERYDESKEKSMMDELGFIDIHNTNFDEILQISMKPSSHTCCLSGCLIEQCEYIFSIDKDKSIRRTFLNNQKEYTLNEITDEWNEYYKNHIIKKINDMMTLLQPNWLYMDDNEIVNFIGWDVYNNNLLD